MAMMSDRVSATPHQRSVIVDGGKVAVSERIIYEV